MGGGEELGRLRSGVRDGLMLGLRASRASEISVAHISPVNLGRTSFTCFRTD